MTEGTSKQRNDREKDMNLRRCVLLHVKDNRDKPRSSGIKGFKILLIRKRCSCKNLEKGWRKGDGNRLNQEMSVVEKLV